VSAIRLRNYGMRVALVERRFLGGECTNWGCIPSKALINLARFVRLIKLGRRAGLEAELKGIRHDRLMGWVRQSVMRSRRGVEYLLSGVDVFKGQARIEDNHRIKVLGDDGSVEEVVEADNLIIATGTEPRSVSGLEIDGDLIISNRDFFELEKLPDSMAVVGAGPIGVELGTALSSLGVTTYLVEIKERVLPTFDPDVSAVIHKYLRKVGVEVFTSSKAKVLEKGDGGVKLRIIQEGGGRDVVVDKVIVAAGRKYNTSGLGLERVGVKLREDGSIQVDEKLRTSVHNIYAVGDVTGPPLLAHKAFRQAINAADVIALGKAKHAVGPIPLIIYSSPEVGIVGLSEGEARVRGCAFKVFKYPYSAVPREFTKLERFPDGFAKLIVGDDRTILGAEVVGDEASELIHIFSLAIGNGIKADGLLNTVYAHPTMAEVVGELAHVALNEPVHAEKGWFD
jgi:dihydrolipoamide dehydrogenase